MKKKPSFKTLLKEATVSVRRRAAREKSPVAISKNGNVILVYPDKKQRIIYKTPKRKRAS